MILALIAFGAVIAIWVQGDESHTPFDLPPPVAIVLGFIAAAGLGAAGIVAIVRSRRSGVLGRRSGRQP